MAKAAMDTSLRNTAASHSLAPSPCSRDPYRCQLPPHRATWCLKPLDAASTAVPLVGRRGSSSSIRELQSIPNLALSLVGLAVSLRTEPLSPRCRFLPVTAGSVEPESSSPTAMTPPWLEPTRTMYERANATIASAGARSTQLFLLPCTTTPNPSTPELRLPLPSSRQSSPAALATAACCNRRV